MLADHHAHFAKRPPPGDDGINRVYHYTSIDVARSIISGKSLWASNVHYMNDYVEYKHGIEIMQRVLRELQSNPAWNSRAPVLREVESYLPRMERRHIFAACFCESDDLLSQWRGYANDGVALGFKYDELSAAMAGFNLAKCAYHEADKLDIARTFISLSLPNPNAPGITVADEAARVGEILLGIVPFFKDAHFEEEQEWRLVSQYTVGAYDSQRGFRAKGRDLIPYIKLSFNNPTGKNSDGHDMLPLDRAMTGPRRSAEDKTSITEAFQYLFFSEKIAWTKIDVSGIPFRS